MILFKTLNFLLFLFIKVCIIPEKVEIISEHVRHPFYFFGSQFGKESASRVNSRFLQFLPEQNMFNPVIYRIFRTWTVLKESSEKNLCEHHLVSSVLFWTENVSSGNRTFRQYLCSVKDLVRVWTAGFFSSCLNITCNIRFSGYLPDNSNLDNFDVKVQGRICVKIRFCSSLIFPEQKIFYPANEHLEFKQFWNRVQNRLFFACEQNRKKIKKIIWYFKSVPGFWQFLGKGYNHSRMPERWKCSNRSFVKKKLPKIKLGSGQILDHLELVQALIKIVDQIVFISAHITLLD